RHEAETSAARGLPPAGRFRLPPPSGGTSGRPANSGRAGKRELRLCAPSAPSGRRGRGPLAATPCRRRGSTMRQTTVAVIGAGPAGLTAAYLLSKHAVPVTVLEADPTYVGGISRT